jgi:putative oxidoreductase
LSVLRIIAAFVYGVHGAQKFFGFPAPFPVPHLPPLFLAGGMIETFGGLLLLIGLFTRPLPSSFGALLLHLPISRERGWRAVEL